MNNFNITNRQYTLLKELSSLSSNLDMRKKTPFVYEGIRIFSKQLALLDAIRKNPEENLIGIAEKTNKAKGTIHLQIDRLLEMGLVEKGNKLGSLKETRFSLTEKGEKIWVCHNQNSVDFLDFLQENTSFSNDEDLQPTLDFLSSLNIWIQKTIK